MTHAGWSAGCTGRVCTTRGTQGRVRVGTGARDGGLGGLAQGLVGWLDLWVQVMYSTHTHTHIYIYISIYITPWCSHNFSCSQLNP
jgi:hypothetical protein